MSGVKHEAKDLRIYDYEKVVGSVGTSFPKKFSLKDRMTVKNQGDVGACLACVLASVAEYIWGKEMSEGFNYGMFREDKDKTPGLYLGKALSFATKLGFVPFDDFGILQEVPEMRELAKKFPELLEIGQKYKISGYAEITTLRTKRDNAIKDALTKGNIGLVAVSDDYFGECHAIMLTGWDDEQDAYEFQNSWGKDFGVDGVGYIPKNEVDDVVAILTEPIKLPFTDVAEDAWYYKSVKNMYMSGLVNGTSETTFEPDRPITRAEICAILDRLCSAEEKNNARIFKTLNELIGG
jgi:hypothetical protein